MNVFAKRAIIVMAGLLVACGDKNIEIPPVVEPEKPNKPGNKPVEPVEVKYAIGSLFGYEGPLRKGEVRANNDPSSTRYNLPLFQSSPEQADSEWWDNLVEEIAYSGMDYAMANTRGLSPAWESGKYNDHGDPRKIKLLVEAMERRGVADKFKVIIFDDTPASWAASRNNHLYGEYTPARKEQSGKLIYDWHTSPLDDTGDQKGIYKYVWDWNIKIAFENLPEKYWFKFQGRPVLYVWSPNGFVPGGDNSCSGKFSAIFKRLRADFKATFGADPFIVVDQAFTHRDSSVKYPIVDGINDWFGMEKAKWYTVREVNKLKFGVGIPGFSVNDKKGNNHMFVDANHGKTLSDALSGMAKQGADLVLIEGFTDVYENAALLRSTDKKFYDYPNQRLNIMRRFSKEPYPKNRRIEAESCDYFADNTPGNSGGAFRADGDIDVKKCSDTNLGWHVTDASAGEWMQWKELPLRAATTTFKIRYSSTAAAEVSFKVGNNEGAKVSLPSTGGVWKTADAGTVKLDKQSLNDVTLKIVAGTLEINWFDMVASE